VLTIFRLTNERWRIIVAVVINRSANLTGAKTGIFHSQRPRHKTANETLPNTGETVVNIIYMA